MSARRPLSSAPLALAGAAILVAALATPASAGPAVDRCWDGTWSESGPPGTQRFAFRLRLSMRGGRAEGAFTWRQIHVSWDPGGDGSIGQEYVRGAVRGDRIELAGYRVSTNELALDRYRITVDGDRIRGQSASLEDDWTARLTGRRVPCPPRRGTSPPPG